MFKHIIVGVDGREGGRDAVALARLLVGVGGKLTLAYVVAPDAGAYPGTSGATAGKRVSKRTFTGTDPLLWDAACMSCAT